MLRLSWQRVQNLTPLTKGVISYSLLWPTGSLLQQTIAGKNWKTYDWGHCARFTAFGALFIAPNVFYWQRILNHMWPEMTLMNGIKKSLVDVIAFSPYMGTCFFYGLSVLEGRNHKQAIEEVKQKLWPTMKTHIQFWPIANTLNFGLVPEQHRIIVTSFCSVIWTAFLAYMKSTNMENQEKFNKLQ